MMAIPYLQSRLVHLEFVSHKSGHEEFTLLVLIFAGTYFRSDINDHISRVHIFADLPSKCCKYLSN